MVGHQKQPVTKQIIMPCVMIHAFNPKTLKAEADRSVGVQGHPDLYNEFEASQG